MKDDSTNLCQMKHRISVLWMIRSKLPFLNLMAPTNDEHFQIEKNTKQEKKTT